MTLSPVQEDAWLVIPLFNEASVIGQVLEQARQVFPHVVCVDDASTDGSADRAREAGAVVVQHPFNLGQGAALQTGLRYVLEATDAAYLVTFDADGQHRAADAADMVQRAKEEDLAVVFGSRFLDDRTQPGRLKRVVLKLAVWLTNQQTGMKLTDAHNGLRVIRRDAAERLDLRQNRMAHATEIVLQLGRTRLPWAEQPVHVLYTDYSRAKGQSLMNSVNILVDTILK
jgi:glycosyltransferase involved in cell wall biosynthesis